MNNALKSVFGPLRWLRNKHDDYLRKHNPEKMFCTIIKRNTGLNVNIDHPQNLVDKIAYLEYRTDTSLWTQLADKVAVRNFVTNNGFGENLTKLYGVWNKSCDINFELLPSTFVIKTNNASGTNIIVKDKTCIDFDEIRKTLDIWLQIDYGMRVSEPHYSDIKPLILAEELLYDEKQKKGLIDYKFFCVNGKAEYVQVMTERIPNTHIMKFMTFDMEWNEHPEFNRGVHENVFGIERPVSFDKMKSMAEKLSSQFKFVRADFYEINGKPIFGELTFTPGFSTTSNSFIELVGKDICL